MISEREKRGKTLKEDQKKVKENVAASSKQVGRSFSSILRPPDSSWPNYQVKLWGDLERLFECKRKCLERAAVETDDNVIHREQGAETLVL